MGPYLQDSVIKASKKRNANFVSKLASIGVYTDISPVMHPDAPK